MSTLTQDDKKRAVARKAIDFVPDDSIIGVGTGSTVNFFIDELARIKARSLGERCPDALRDKRYGSWFAGYVSESYRRTNQMLIDRIDALSGFIDEKTPVEIVRINETTVYVKQA